MSELGGATIGWSSYVLAGSDPIKACVRGVGLGAGAMELSSLHETELEGVLAAAQSEWASEFTHVSVHGPAQERRMSERELVAKLSGVSQRVVMHPDTMSELSAWRSMGNQLVIENMDSRKTFGRVAEELDLVFAELGEAGFCLDVSHACNVGGTELAVELAKRYGSRLAWVHLGCACGEACGDTLEDELGEALGAVLDELGGAVPVILERKTVAAEALDGQLSMVSRLVS